MASKVNDRLIAFLHDQAESLNSINRRKWFARPFYEMFADGLIWSDETVDSWPTTNAARPLVRHRSALILGVDDDSWFEYWHIAKEICPNWIGFHRSRCKSAPKLRKLIRTGRLRMLRDCRQLEKEWGENNFLSERHQSP